ncbi:hypothetical protein BH09ACT12_BH09ACT12_09390 [soil metagenome]
MKLKRRHDERGAVAMMVAGLMVAVVAVAAFAVDLGMQRVVRSDMQALADVVALDAARLLDGRPAGEIRAGTGDLDPLSTVVRESVRRNVCEPVDTDPCGSRKWAVDDSDVTAVLILVDQDAMGATVPLRDPISGQLEPVEDDETPDAVLVEAAGSVDFAFAPGSGSATRTALATSSSYGCFRLGSFAASLKSDDSALIGVFESLVGDALGINLRAVGYEGLIDSSIGIAALAAELGVGTTTELANLTNVKLADLLRASAVVLDDQGDTEAGAELANIAAKISQTISLDIAQVLTVGDGSTLAGDVNAVDLLGSAALGISAVLADSNNFLDTGVAWSAPHVSSGDIELKAIASPAQYCGPVGGGTSTAQVSLVSDFDFTLPNSISLGTLGSLSVSTQSDTSNKKSVMHIDATLAGATGTLVGVTCGEGTGASKQLTEVDVDSNLLTANVSLPFRVKGNLDVSTSNLVPSSVLTGLFGALQTGATVSVALDLKGSASAKLSTPAATATAPTVFSVPPLAYGEAMPSHDAGQPVALPTPSVVLETTGSVTVSVTTSLIGIGLSTTTKLVPVSSLNLTALLSALTSSVIGTSTSTVVSNVNQALVPVSKLLGVRVAGADLIGTFPPSCSSPSLVG